MKSLGEQTLYEILDVPPGAPPAEIERAYERAVTLYGPGSIVTYTLMSAEEASQLSTRIEEARRTLLDAAHRARYDETLGLAPRPEPRPEGPGAPVPEAVAASPEAAPVAPAPAAEAASLLPPAPAGAAAVASTPAPVPLATVASGGATPAPLPLTTVASGGAMPAPIPLRVEAGRAVERDVVVAEDAAWSGEVLRRVREARGISVQQISERTRVVRHHVENIEAERFGLLPAPVYLRGILQALARELRLDPQKVSRSYLERLQVSGVSPPPPPTRSR